MKKINLALAGHTSVGKTSFLDTLLCDAGAAATAGRVDDGKSLSDYDEEEIKRRISIRSSAFSVSYRDTVITVIDTPGSSDFAGEVVSSLHAVDCVLLLVDAVSGVEIETTKTWNRARKMELPLFLFVNKIDKEHADFDAVLENLRDNLKAKIVPVLMPIGQESKFNGVVDLIKMKAFIYEGDRKKAKEQEIPAELKGQAEEMRNQLVETAAESSEELTDKYLGGDALTTEEVMKGLKAAIEKRQAFPLMVGSALHNKGVGETVDALVELSPESGFRGSFTAYDASTSAKSELKIEYKKNAKFVGLVFKTVIDQFAGKISFVRVLAGSVRSEEEVFNSTRDKKEKLSKLGFPFGKTQHPMDRNAEEGDIIVLTKLPYAETGDTLAALDKHVLLPRMVLPNPVHSVAIRAKNKKEEDKLSSLLQRAAEEDISFKIEYNKETKQTVISGMGELQINIILSKIRDRYGIEYETSTPLVAYRETILAAAKANYKHKKQTGGHGQYGEVYLEVEPLPRGGGFEFLDRIVGGAIPKNYIPGVEKGVREALDEGVVAGYPVVDVRAAVVFGSYHDVDSSELAFKIAGRTAFKLAMEQGKPTLLEPIMDLTVFVDEKYTGDVMSDLNSKRGRVLGMDNLGGAGQVIRAKVPQAELLKYAIELRSVTSGTGSFEMEFSHYEPISGKIAEDVIKETLRRKEEAAKEK
jgi:elongation factor G